MSRTSSHGQQQKDIMERSSHGEHSKPSAELPNLELRFSQPPGWRFWEVSKLRLHNWASSCMSFWVFFNPLPGNAVVGAHPPVLSRPQLTAKYRPVMTRSLGHGRSSMNCQLPRSTPRYFPQTPRKDSKARGNKTRFSPIQDSSHLDI